MAAKNGTKKDLIERIKLKNNQLEKANRVLYRVEEYLEKYGLVEHLQQYVDSKLYENSETPPKVQILKKGEVSNG